MLCGAGAGLGLISSPVSSTLTETRMDFPDVPAMTVIGFGHL
ncbi:hypothetical protein AGRO_4609 [Agrobacterium sp. ATCC 31749]|nr:hypothetical protein AGRO_4609 [Agrobacterium sp. ATCC 31749]